MITLAPESRIPLEEFAERRERAVALAAERGLDGLVVWSRGGNTGDFYGDVFYLANHMTAFPTQPDNLPLWAGRGHSVLILPTGGEPVMIVDSYDYRDDLAAVKDVRVGLNVPAMVGAILKELGIAGAALGLAGRDSFLFAHHDLVREAAGVETLNFVACDDILATMRHVKSAAELDMMRDAAGVGVAAMEEMLAAVREGGTEADVAGEGWRAVARRGGLPYDTAIASGPNSQHFQWARLPSWDHRRTLVKGDLFHVDLYGPMAQGYWVDMARTTVVGGSASATQESVLEAAVTLVETIVTAVRPGVTYGDLWAIGNDWRHANGFPLMPDGASGCLIGLDADFPAYGHSLGLGLESFLIKEGSSVVVEPNMVISVETLLSREGVGGANYEENVVVTTNGCERLTAGSPARHW